MPSPWLIRDVLALSWIAWFDSDSADMCAEKFPLVSMGGWAEGLACADPGARTPMVASGNFDTQHPATPGKIMKVEIEMSSVICMYISFYIFYLMHWIICIYFYVLDLYILHFYSCFPPLCVLLYALIIFVLSKPMSSANSGYILRILPIPYPPFFNKNCC